MKDKKRYSRQKQELSITMVILALIASILLILSFRPQIVAIVQNVIMRIMEVI